MLNLHEQFFLLSLHEDKVAPTSSTVSGFPFWLGGTILVDLALRERVSFEPKHRLQLVSADPTGEPFLDGALGQIQAAEQPKKIRYWMENFEYKPKKVFQQLSEQLVIKGVLSQEDEDFAWVIPYPPENPLQASAKFALRRRLRGLILANEGNSLPDLALVGLIQASGKLDLLFFKDELKLARRRIDERIMGEALTTPVGQTIQEIETVLSAHMDED